MSSANWETCKAAEVGKIFVDRFDEGIRFLIMRGPGSLCAYVGVPLDHPLADKSYDDLPVSCHGGLTFARASEGKLFPVGFFWYGWDYSHCDDAPMYERYVSFSGDEKQWDVEMVEKDSWNALYDFRKLVKLAESIAAIAKEKVNQDRSDV